MKKWLIPVIIIAILGFGIYNWAVGFNNTAVTLNENVSEAWGNVQTSYQRRNDLIGNLVNTVKGAADFERSTLEAVVNARAKATSMNIDPSNMTPQQLEQFQQAQSGVSSALGRLLVTVERYPDLKANQNFLKLQDELASTENQILTARTRFNESVQMYNGYVLRMPNKFFLSGYPERPFFKSEAGAEVAPEVEFNF